MTRERPTFREQIRQIIEDCGLSRYAISKATGIDQSQLSRFMSGERMLSMNALDRLAAFLELEIKSRRPQRGHGGSRPKKSR